MFVVNIFNILKQIYDQHQNLIIVIIIGHCLNIIKNNIKKTIVKTLIIVTNM